MPEENAKFLEILIGQMRKNRDVDAILSEALRILGKADILQPLGDMVHHPPSYQ
jgi:hypothetical protein